MSTNNNICEACSSVADEYLIAAIYSFPSPYSPYPEAFSYMWPSLIRDIIWRVFGQRVVDDPRLTAH